MSTGKTWTFKIQPYPRATVATTTCMLEEIQSSSTIYYSSIHDIKKIHQKKEKTSRYVHKN